MLKLFPKRFIFLFIENLIKDFNVFNE